MIGLMIKPIARNIIPPINSYFQARTSNPVKMNEGIRWMRKPIICSPSGLPASKASRANRLTKRIAAIHKIRGVQ